MNSKQPHISAYDAEVHHAKRAGRIIALYMGFLSLVLFIAVPFAVWATGETDFGANLARILTSPSKLVTDYFALGGLGSAFFNAAVCGLACNFIVLFSRAKVKAPTLAGYMLVIAHGF